jgi:putative transposase
MFVSSVFFPADQANPRVGLARSTIDWQRRERTRPVARREPLGSWADDELVAHIRRVLAVSPFPGEGYRQVWDWLRLRRAHYRLAPTRQGQPHGSKAHDGTISPAHIETMRGTDRTAT